MKLLLDTHTFLWIIADSPKLHLAIVSTLPFHHRDPFDRLLAAQSITERLPIVSIDDKFDLYGVKRLW